MPATRAGHVLAHQDVTEFDVYWLALVIFRGCVCQIPLSHSLTASILRSICTTLPFTSYRPFSDGQVNPPPFLTFSLTVTIMSLP